MYYEYKEGKKRVNDILNSSLQIIEKDNIPSEDTFTFDNAYKCWVTSIFVDIRDSTTLFSNDKQVMVAKIIKSFTSEIIEILREGNTYNEIGIRGDCVYAVYSSPKQNDISEIMDKVFWINTLFKMLNKLFEQKGYETIKAGIGVSSAQEVIIKAGRKGTGINSKVWIGDAVTKASKLSSLSNKNNISPIALSDCTYINMIDNLTKNNSDAPNWFTQVYDYKYGKYYHGDIIKSEFNEWINGGMK